MISNCCLFIVLRQTGAGAPLASLGSSKASETAATIEASTMSSSHMAGEAGPLPSSDESTINVEAEASAEKTGRPETPEADNKNRCSPSSTAQEANVFENKSSSADNSAKSDSIITGVSKSKATSKSSSVTLDQSVSPTKIAHRKTSIELPRRLSNKEKPQKSLGDEIKIVSIEGVDEDDDGEDIVIGKEITCSKCLGKSLLEVKLTILY